MAAFDTSAPLLPEILSLHGKWKDSKPVLVCEGRTVSWREFEANTNRIAHALIANGISRGHMVGVVMSNGIAMVEVLVAIMKSGACSVPINLSVSDEALEAMLSDAGVSAVFSTTDQTARLKPYLKAHQQVLSISDDTLPAFSAGASESLPDVGLRGDDPLNVIYSSGTTGMPKGILHVHQGRRDWAYDLAIALRYHSAARTLFTIGLYSNISWVAMLCTLLAGGTMVIAPKFDARDTLATIEKERITHFTMVPIQYQRLMEVPDQETFDLSTIEAVMSCGSPLHADLKETLFKRLGPKAVIELFGLTEGVITTLDPEDAEGRMASVGKPLIGTDIKIIGDDDKEVPRGKSGEIVGCGRIVMPGYLNRADATAEATWIDEHGKAWLRTGDIGQLDEEGYLYIVDRKKDMILSGGQNIYPQDIEAVLIKHEAVNEVAVIGVKSERWGETPLAVVVREAGADVDDTTLTTWANERLGKQQRISGVQFIDALPRNANGKILKRELRTIYGG
jgi:acyl-CoA synthetase (AMP-forming)/AMP-acid ligase II